VARAAGAGEAQAFMTAFHAMFHTVGVAAALTGVLVAWAVHRQRRQV
jgi:hypothetical protein